MYAFTSSRKLAATTKPCANCARPIRLGAVRAPESAFRRSMVEVK